MQRTAMAPMAWFVVLAMLATGCGDGSGPSGTGVASVQVTPTTTSLFTVEPGNTVALTAVARDQAGQTVAGVPVTFSSSNTSAATVAAGGLVTAVSAGTATITASVTSGGATKTGNATVIVAVAPSTATVTAPQVLFTPRVVDVSAGGEVTWSIAGVHHTITFNSSGAPADIPEIMNASASRTFPTHGDFAYHCEIHAGMTGTVSVH